MKRALVVAALLCSATAFGAERWQNGIDGVGRISVLAGWKLTPNDWFFSQSAGLGYPAVTRGIGGPQAQASFGYGAIRWLEIAIDLFIGHDRFAIEGYDPITVLTYGALIGVRFTFMDTFFPGFAPFFGVGVGPTLGYVFTGTHADETHEKLVTGVSANAGVAYRINDSVGLSLEYRFLYARGVFNTSGVNVGGSWFSLGVVIYFPRTISASDRMLGGP